MSECKVPGHFAYEMDFGAENHPALEVVTFENGDHLDEVLTYESIVTNGRKIALALQKADIGKGDILALVMRNHT